MDGIAIVDKAEGWTSHDVVAKFRGIAKTRRVGHLGTLDPMATGVLPLAVGVATRLARFYTHAEKLYEGVVRFGYATDTYDRTGTATSEPSQVALSEHQLELALAKFRGTTLQMPPQYSAKKVRGIVAYKAARMGVEVEIQPVAVTVHEITVLRFDGERVELRIRCSAGTYIRSIAHDLGVALGCGAHLDSLRRLASGEFTIERAKPLGEEMSFVPMAELLPQFPIFVADLAGAAAIRQGRNFTAPGFDAVHIRALSDAGELIAICDRTGLGDYHPSVVLG